MHPVDVEDFLLDGPMLLLSSCIQSSDSGRDRNYKAWCGKEGIPPHSPQGTPAKQLSTAASSFVTRSAKVFCSSSSTLIWLVAGILQRRPAPSAALILGCLCVSLYGILLKCYRSETVLRKDS